MIIIGERLNSSIPEIKMAIENRDEMVLANIAKAQADAGASYIDVNAGMFRQTEGETLKWLAKIALDAGNLPLSFDSPSPEALGYAIKDYKGEKPIINSISFETERFNAIVPLVKEYNTSVIALCMDDSGIPENAPQRVEIALKIADALQKHGVKLNDIYFDPMVRPIGVDSEAGKVAIEAITAIRRELPEAHITCGLSNISFGLPKRRLINRAFLSAVISAGLDSPIMDPNDADLMAVAHAAEALFGDDEYCINYLEKFRNGEFD